jgi:hypothetical protein
MNQINVINPYRTQYGWAFDDENVGLIGEPFVAGIPEIIDSIVGSANNFTAYFSHEFFPDSTFILNKIEDNVEAGSYYRLNNTEMVGWLCPATLKYFEDYPTQIFVQIKV